MLIILLTKIVIKAQLRWKMLSCGASHEALSHLNICMCADRGRCCRSFRSMELLSTRKHTNVYKYVHDEVASRA